MQTKNLVENLLQPRLSRYALSIITVLIPIFAYSQSAEAKSVEELRNELRAKMKEERPGRCKNLKLQLEVSDLDSLTIDTSAKEPDKIAEAFKKFSNTHSKLQERRQELLLCAVDYHWSVSITINESDQNRKVAYLSSIKSLLNNFPEERISIREDESYSRGAIIALDGKSVAQYGLSKNAESWADLAKYRLTALTKLSLAGMGASELILSDAKGRNVNLDSYPVIIYTMPQLGIGRFKLNDKTSSNEMLNLVMKNINLFIDTRNGKFEPYSDSDVSEEWSLLNKAIWNSRNSTGSILHIQIPKNDGSVVVDQPSDNKFVFSTIYTKGDHNHPVSGNREFSISKSTTSSGQIRYVIHNRGVDRVTDSIESILEASVFEGAESLWRSFQEGLVNSINSEFGLAEIGDSISQRQAWDNACRALLSSTECPK